MRKANPTPTQFGIDVLKKDPTKDTLPVWLPPYQETTLPDGVLSDAIASLALCGSLVVRGVL